MNVGKRFSSWLHRGASLLADNAYLVTLGAAIAIVACSAVYTRRVRQESSVAAAALPAQMTASPAPLRRESPVPTGAPLHIPQTRLTLAGRTVWPVGGRVVRAYDDQQPVFWQALSSLRIHDALDIAGEPGETVRAAADGTVERVSRDALWGWRVRVRQTDGRCAVYAGLQDAAVGQGQHVTRGQTLGTLLEQIPCEAELGTHLHMELYRDEKAQDPEGMLPER